MSLLIESLQGISGRRVADVDDLILNTAAGLLGYGCWWVVGRLRRSLGGVVAPDLASKNGGNPAGGAS